MWIKNFNHQWKNIISSYQSINQSINDIGFFFNKYIAHPCLYRTSIKSNDFKQVSKLSSDTCIYLLSEANEIHYKKENIYIVPLLYYINFQVHNLKILICNFLKRIVCVSTKNNQKKRRQMESNRSNVRTNSSSCFTWNWSKHGKQYSEREDLSARILGWRKRLAMIIENVDLISEDQLIARWQYLFL